MVKSSLKYFFANSKVFRFNAILHDSVGSVKSRTRKGRVYFFVAPSFPLLFFLGHVIRLLSSSTDKKKAQAGRTENSSFFNKTKKFLSNKRKLIRNPLLHSKREENYHQNH